MSRNKGDLGELFQFLGASITKCHKFNNLSTTNLSSYSSVGWKSKIKKLAGLYSFLEALGGGESLFPWLFQSF